MRFFSLFFLALVLTASTAAQSTNQNFPTPITSSEIEGTIKARDVGDARLTSYYYQFDAGQGDLFINIVTRNLTGDIDVFTQTGLKPLTKIVVYGDLAENETGRVLYFRKPEKLILRIQGRTPGDEAATFRLKFAGSFVASTQTEGPVEPALPSLSAKNDSGIKVNSVGTIVAVIPKATPTPPAVANVAAIPDERDQEEPKKEQPEEVTAVEKSEEKPAETNAGEQEKKVEVVVTENIPPKTESVTPPKSTRTARGRRTPPPPVATVIKPKPEKEATTAAPKTGRTNPSTASSEKTPDPLEKINLVIEFKDGTKIERPMSEVLRFSVDKGVLTVIAKDGSIGRYSILVVDKVTIQ